VLRDKSGVFDRDPIVEKWFPHARVLVLVKNSGGLCVCVRQDLLEYKKKHRVLRVRMLDGSVKTLMVDDSQTVAQLMITVCSKIGASFCRLFTCLVTSGFDTTHDVSSASRRACRAVLFDKLDSQNVWARHIRRVEPVELVVSSRAVRQARHSQNAWAEGSTRRTCRVVSCRVET